MPPGRPERYNPVSCRDSSDERIRKMTVPDPITQGKLPAALHLDDESSGAGVCVRFSSVPAALAQGADFPLPLVQLEGPESEAWWLLGESDTLPPPPEGIRAVAAGGLMVCEAFRGETADPRATARTIYAELLDYIARAGYPHIVKGWNYLADINVGEGDGERYKTFCMGRGEALDAGWRQDYLPAGTGVGGDTGSGLCVTLLASQERPLLIENPRQVSAYRYPRQYGPKSPSFSRAAAIGGDRRWLFISGTAAIVGHDSLHTSSIEGQVRETLRNWSSLFDAYEALDNPRPTLTDQAWYRIYLRHESHLPVARAMLVDAGLPLAANPVFPRRHLSRGAPVRDGRGHPAGLNKPGAPEGARSIV